MKYHHLYVQCPCCFNFSLKIYQEFTLIVDICPVCYYQFDKYCHSSPCDCRGANPVTLFDAQQNYLEMGASDNTVIRFTRKPKINELPENNEYLFYENIKVVIKSDDFTCLGVAKGDVGDVVQILPDSTYIVDCHKEENKVCRIWASDIDFEIIK